MSIANKLVYANRDYKAHFVEEFEAGKTEFEPVLKDLMMEFPSSGPGVDHSFSDALGSLEEWVDTREMDKLGADSFYVENKSYARGVEVDRDDLEDDNHGLFMPRIKDLANKYWRHRFDQIGTLLNNGATTLCWDGKYFFDDDHPLADSDSVNDNLSTLACSTANVQTVITQLRAMMDTQGNKLKLQPTAILHGDDLEWTVKAMLENERDANGASNPMYNYPIKRIQVNTMTAGSWAVCDLSRSLKPLMFQDRRKPEFVECIDPRSSEVFHTKKFKWGIDYRGRSAHAFYQTIVWSSGS